MTTMTHTVAGHASLHAQEEASFLARLTADVATAWRRKRLRDKLARMSDAELMDIGIAEEELHLVHAGATFTPKAWSARGARLA